MQLLVNIDHIATLRNARGEDVPDPVEAAIISEKAGAAGIVFHLREDRRHIKDDDVYRLVKVIKGVIDFEMAATPEMLNICAKVKPHVATLVPEKRMELTTEGGLNMKEIFEDYRSRVIPFLKEKNVKISLFVDPNPTDIELAYKLGVEAVELHTGTYAHAFGKPAEKKELDRLQVAAKIAQESGLLVNAGHGLNLHNTKLLIKTVPFLNDISIGHALISHAIYHGLYETVTAYVSLISSASKSNK